MLQLKHKANEYELTDRTTVVSLTGRDIKLADEAIQEPGEYEVNNIEVVYGNTAALIVWEHLQIAYVMSLETPGAFEKDQFSSSDVLVIADGLTELTKHAFDELMSAYDPKIVIVSPATAIESSLKTNLKLEDNNTIKLASASLPEEGRVHYLAA